MGGGIQVAPTKEDYDETASGLSTPMHQRLQLLEKAYKTQKCNEKGKVASPKKGIIHDRLQWLEEENKKAQSHLTPDCKDAKDYIPSHLVQDRKRWLGEEMLVQKILQPELKKSCVSGKEKRPIDDELEPEEEARNDTDDNRDDLESGAGRTEEEEEETEEISVVQAPSEASVVLAPSETSELLPLVVQNDEPVPGVHYLSTPVTDGSNSLVQYAQLSVQMMAEADVPGVVANESLTKTETSAKQDRSTPTGYRNRRSIQSWRQPKTEQAKTNQATDQVTDQSPTFETDRQEDVPVAETKSETEKMTNSESESEQPKWRVVPIEDQSQQPTMQQVEATDVQCLDFCTIL